MKVKQNSNISTIRKILIVALAAIVMIVMMPTQPVSAKEIKVKSIQIDNPVEVLAEGQEYELKISTLPKNANEDIKFRSSDTSVAKITKYGTIHVKKSGNVTFTVITESGKKATLKMRCVSKYGVTALQQRINMMLKAKHIKNIYIQNFDSKESYTVKKGNYSDKVLRVDAPASDVTNYGSFKQIRIKSLSKNSFHEYGNDNQFYLNGGSYDLKIHQEAYVKNIEVVGKVKSGDIYIWGDVETLNMNAKKGSKIYIHVMKGGTIEKLQINGKSYEVSLEIEGSIKDLIIKGTDCKVNTTLDKNAKMESFRVERKSNVVLDGSLKTLAVSITNNAKNTSITSSIPLMMDTSTDISAIFNLGAEGSRIKKATTRLKVSVDNQTTQSVYILSPAYRSDEMVEPGSKEIVPVPGGIAPIVTPSVTPTATVTPTVTVTPTTVPTGVVVYPTVTPIIVPTVAPTTVPTTIPTVTVAPTVLPTAIPTEKEVVVKGTYNKCSGNTEYTFPSDLTAENLVGFDVTVNYKAYGEISKAATDAEIAEAKQVYSDLKTLLDKWNDPENDVKDRERLGILIQTGCLLNGKRKVSTSGSAFLFNANGSADIKIEMKEDGVYTIYATEIVLNNRARVDKVAIVDLNKKKLIIVDRDTSNVIWGSVSYIK